jgi:uncharacterized tellurite resistance protein B-like protein
MDPPARAVAPQHHDRLTTCAMLDGMSIPAEMLKSVVKNASGKASTVAPEDVWRAFKIACLVVVADGKLADEEVAALRVMSAELHGLGDAGLDALIQSCLNLPGREDRLEQLRATADSLTTEEARHLAYKLAVTTALADLASTDEEFEFDLDVQEALQLAPDVADRLAGEVHEALTPAE